MHLILDDAPLGGVTMTIHPIELAPDDGDVWMARALGAPAGSVVHTLTDLGWPLTLAHAAVRGADGAVVEYRVGAFYRFFHFAAAAVARLPDRAVLTARLPDLVGLWRTGRPDFRGGGVVALAELWIDAARLLH